MAERARVALVALHGGGLDHVAADVDRGFLEERIEDRGARVGHQDHVRLVDALPAGDGGAVEHLAVAEQFFVHEPCGDRDVLFFAACVGEAQVGKLDLFFFDQFESHRLGVISPPEWGNALPARERPTPDPYPGRAANQCRAYASFRTLVNQRLGEAGDRLCTDVGALVGRHCTDEGRRFYANPERGERTARRWCGAFPIRAYASPRYTRAFFAHSVPIMTASKLGTPPRTFQDLIFALQRYWSDQGCVILQPYDMEMGAGTFHPPPFCARSGLSPGAPPTCSLRGVPPTGVTAKTRSGCSTTTSSRW